MLHYVYYPFPQTSATGPNKTVLDRYVKKYTSAGANTHDEKLGDHVGGVVKYRGASLAGVRDDDMLLIASHGGEKDPNTICSDEGRSGAVTSERLTANDLARQLSDALLPKTHVLIKMLSCFASGILAKEGPAIVRRPVGGSGEEFFAKMLAVALKKNYSYNAIIVGGYSGAFMNTTIASHRFSRAPFASNSTPYNRVSVDGGSPVEAHGHIHWVDGDGAVVDPARIKALKRASDLREGSFAAASAHQKAKGRAEVFTRART